MSFNQRFNLEPLERRQLMAGVTLLIHGHEGSIKGWIASAADAIADRVDGVSQYVMKIGESGDNLAVKSFKLQNGPGLTKSSTGEVVIKVDWTSVDNGDYSTAEAGRVVADYLMASHGSTPALAELPIHLIGHSRGASLAVSMTRRLGRSGIWVDQATFLDPHPVDGFFGYGDTSMRVYDNVIFADNYWRDDGNEFNFDPDGERVTGTYQGDLNNTVQKDHVISAHMAVTAYYHGTIDDDAVANKDHPIFKSWYGNTSDKPARNRTGYYFSRLGGGERPKEGLIAGFGGTGQRSKTEKSGTQWSNAGDLELGGSSFKVGQRLKLKFIRQDRDSAGTVTIYLDKDRNPFNGDFTHTLRSATINRADEMTATRMSTSTSNAPKGDCYVVVKTTDASGHSRFVYSNKMKLT